MRPTQAINQTIEAEAAASQLTKGQLAETLGIARGNLRNRLNGHIPWNVAELETAANRMGMSFWDLMALAEARSARDAPVPKEGSK